MDDFRKPLKCNWYSIWRRAVTPGKPRLAPLVCACAGQVAGDLPGFEVENLLEKVVNERRLVIQVPSKPGSGLDALLNLPPRRLGVRLGLAGPDDRLLCAHVEL